MEPIEGLSFTPKYLEHSHGFSTAEDNTEKEEPAGDCAVSIGQSVNIDNFGNSEEGSAQRDSEHLLSLVDVTYTVQEWQGSWWKGCCFRQRRTKHILQEVNMAVKSRQLTAILGNSGSGKTTVLDFISGRLHGYGTEKKGKVLLNGQELTEEEFRVHGGYVIQADRLLPSLTVKETLTYTARLQNAGSSVSRAAIEYRVDQIMSDLGIRHIENSLVGGHLVRGISGGERRRVSIAVQMIQDPDVLLLDEPTTGLDSFTSHYLIQKLSDIALKQNKIIFITIHQPRSDIFKIFDQIGILTNGKVQYFGARTELIPHFTSLGYPCPTYANPLDYYIDLASVDRRDQVSEMATSQRLDILRQTYLQSDVYQQVKEITSDSEVTGETENAGRSYEVGDEAGPTCMRLGQGVITAFKLIAILLSRMYLNLWRDHVGFVMRFVQLPINSVFLWLFLWRLSSDVNTAIQDRSGLFFMCLTVSAMVGVLDGAAFFPQIRDQYYREAREGQYQCHHILLAYFIHILPFQVTSSVVFSVVVHWAVGLAEGASRFAVFFGVILAQQYLGELLIVCALALLQGAPQAQATSTLLINCFVFIGSGLLKDRTTMVNFVYWISYALFSKWSADIIIANEYHGLRFECEPDAGPLCEIFTGDSYLADRFPDAKDNMARNAGILSCFVVGLAILCLVIFKLRGIKQLN